MSEESYFRSQLLREDIARLNRLQELAGMADEAAFKKDGAMIGWTPGDTRSWELKSTLLPFLDAFYACCIDPSAINEERAVRAWTAFEDHRMAHLGRRPHQALTRLKECRNRMSALAHQQLKSTTSACDLAGLDRGQPH
jgi:hypothetical protein